MKTPPKKKSFWGFGISNSDSKDNGKNETALKIDHLGDLFALNKFD